LVKTINHEKNHCRECVFDGQEMIQRYSAVVTVSVCTLCVLSKSFSETTDLFDELMQRSCLDPGLTVHSSIKWFGTKNQDHNHKNPASAAASQA
jgi:hypothetical protein